MPIIQPTILDLMEYANDAAAQAAFVTSVPHNSQYPPAHDATYVKSGYAGDQLGGVGWAYQATDPTKSLIGAAGGTTGWYSNAMTTNCTFHIDLGSAKTITQIYYENFHSNGGNTTAGVKNFTLWGSNTAGDFADVAYANDNTWVQITTNQTTFDQHAAANAPDPKYISATNTTAYRYYRFKFADRWGAADWGVMGVRRIELQSSPTILRAYSEATIKQEGSYSLKGVALITDSLNKTLTRTVAPTLNLTGRDIIKFDIRASRTGSNIKIGIHDSGGTTTEITPVIAAADTWQTVLWDISAVTNANKDAIDSIIVTIVNADAENTFYIDNMFGDTINNYLIHRGRDRFRTAGYSLGN